MAEQIKVSVDETVWYEGAPYRVTAASPDITITDDDELMYQLSQSEFFSQYVKVVDSGWVPRPKYRVGRLKESNSFAKGVACCDTAEGTPVWYYIVQRSDNAPELLSEDEMAVECKDGLEGKWISTDDGVFLVKRVNKTTLTIAKVDTPNAQTETIDIKANYHIATQPEHRVGDRVDGGKIVSIQAYKNGFIYVFDDQSVYLAESGKKGKKDGR